MNAYVVIGEITVPDGVCNTYQPNIHYNSLHARRALSETLQTKQYDVAIEWYKQAAAHSPKFAGSDQRFLDALRGGEHFSAVCILSQFG